MSHSRRPKPESLLKSFCDPLESPFVRVQPGLALLAARRQVENATRAASEAMSPAKAADHAKPNLLADMSHDLRMPLNAIIGFSELIRLDGPQARERHLEYAGDMYDAGVSLLQLVGAILDLARAQAGDCDIKEELVPICDIVELPVQILRRPAEDKSISITSTIETPAARVAVDPVRIKQALLNVLSNAIKYTPAGGEVTVEARRDPAGDLMIRITDSGIGIPPARLKRLREPFEPTRAPLTHRSDGTGIGLPIAKALMALHGGDLTIDSEPGHGTSVELRLPGKRIRAPLAAAAD